jgi:hypothetical protein
VYFVPGQDSLLIDVQVFLDALTEGVEQVILTATYDNGCAVGTSEIIFYLDDAPPIDLTINNDTTLICNDSLFVQATATGGFGTLVLRLERGHRRWHAVGLGLSGRNDHLCVDGDGRLRRGHFDSRCHGHDPGAGTLHGPGRAGYPGPSARKVPCSWTPSSAAERLDTPISGRTDWARGPQPMPLHPPRRPTPSPVMDACGLDTTDQVTVAVQYDSVQVVITPDTTICRGDEITLTAWPSSGWNGYELEWDNGSTSADRQVAPSSSTTYEVTATDGCGISATDDVHIGVNAPIAAFTYSGSVFVENFPISFHDQSTGAVSWSWDFDYPGLTSEDQFPVITFPANGLFDVMLAIVDPLGCMDTTYLTVEIEQEFHFYAPEHLHPGWRWEERSVLRQRCRDGRVPHADLRPLGRTDLRVQRALRRMGRQVRG